MGNNPSQDGEDIVITRQDSSATIPKPTNSINGNDNDPTNRHSLSIKTGKGTDTEPFPTSSTSSSKPSNSKSPSASSVHRKSVKQELLDLYSTKPKGSKKNDAKPKDAKVKGEVKGEATKGEMKKPYNTVNIRNSALFESNRASINNMFEEAATRQMQVDKESRIRMDAVLRESGKADLTRLSQDELEWRPRSSSVAVPYYSSSPTNTPKLDPVTHARRASVAIAALRRASLKIEQNMKARKMKKEPSVLSKETKAAIKIQACFRRWIAMKNYKRQLQRMNVVREILITELDYVRFLSVLVKVYYYPLRKSKILSSEEVMAIFPQVEIIKIYNSKFAEQLQGKMREWSCYQTIGDAFVSMVDFLKEPYTIYISQFPDITEKINTCSRRPAVTSFLKKCTKFTEVASMDILSLVSMPFQRIPRYMLLLKECLKFTEKSHKDYELIRIAIKKLDALTQAASERLRMEEGSKSVAKVNALLQPPVQNLVRPYRKLVRDSTIDARFVPVNAKEKDYSMEKNCQLFLFNDCILIAKPLKKSFFESNPELKLKPITVLDLRGAVVLDAIQTGFILRAQDGTATFQAKNWPEKEAWKSDIMDAISSLVDTSDLSSPLSRSASLSRSMHISDSTQLLQPTGLTRNHSMVVPSMTTPKMTSGSTLRLRKPARLTRQFTLPQIFAPTNKFAAPLAVITPRIYRIGRAASYHSRTTQRKQKVVSVREGPSQLLSKSRSLPEILI